MFEMNPGTQKLLIPTPVLKMWVLLAFLALRGCSKDTILDRDVVLRTPAHYI